MPRPALVALALAVASIAVSSAGAQPAGPLAVGRADLDGDGKTDEVRVSSVGVEILFAGARAGETKAFATVSGARAGQVEIANIGREGRVLAVAEDRNGAGEAMWLRTRGRAVSVLWSGPVGLDDEDTGTRVRVEVIAGELYRYYDNPAITRCDGKQARLNAEKLSGGKFRPASPPTEIDSQAPVLSATSRAPSGVAPASHASEFTPRVASSARGTLSPDLLGKPVTLGDRDPRTEWVEDRPGAGRGEFITLAANEPLEIVMVKIVAGAARDAKTFAAHNRPRRVGLIFDGGDRFWVELADAPIGQAQWVALPQSIASQCVTLVLDAVYPSASERGDRGETALSEIDVLTALDVSGAIEETLVDRVVAGDGKAARQLGQMGASAVNAILAKLASKDLPPRAGLRLRRILAAIGAEPDELAIGLGQRSATERDRDELAGALATIGAPALGALGGLIANRGASQAGRARAARLIATIGGAEAVTTLVNTVTALAGSDGERPLRAVVARALGASPPAALAAITAAAASASENTRADFYRAIGLIARGSADKAALSAATSSLLEALASAASYEQRYRLLGALGALPEPRAIEAAAGQLRAMSASKAAREIALRRIVVRALGQNRSPEVAAALTMAIADADPGVRDDAVAALAEHAEASASDAPLGDALTADPWPSVRRNAAGALSTRCTRQAPRAALRAAAGSEKDSRVGQVVLTSVVRCGGSGTSDLLVAIAVASKRPIEIRAHAVSLLDQVSESGIAAKLIALFKRFVGDSFSDEAAIPLAQSAAAGLCRIAERDPSQTAAVAPLADAAENSAYPEIQAAAARALGCYCAPETAELLRRLARSPKPSISVAATRAVEKCKKR